MKFIYEQTRLMNVFLHQKSTFFKNETFLEKLAVLKTFSVIQ